MLRRSYSAADAALRSSSNAPLEKGFAGKSVLRPPTSPSLLEEVGASGRLSRASEPSTHMNETHSKTSGGGAREPGSRDGEGAASRVEK